MTREQVEPMQPGEPVEPMFLIPASLVQALAAYLSKRPYAEVAEGMQALQTLQPYEPERGKDETR